jgi:hypothetical protein
MPDDMSISSMYAMSPMHFPGEDVIATILYLLAAALCAIRGVLEFEMGKSWAYVVQVGGIVAMLVWYISPSALSAYLRCEGRLSLGLGAGLVGIVIVSILMTLAERAEFGFSYVFLFGFTIFLLSYSISNYRRRFIQPGVAYAGVALIALVEGGVAVAQQQGVFPIALPGFTFGFDHLRAPSLTGSYLHYPIFIAVVAALCGVDYLTYKRKLSAVVCAVLTVCIFSALSRSGMLIILGTFALAFFKEPVRFLVRHAKLIVAGLLASAAIIVWGGVGGDSVLSTGAQRIAGTLSLSSDGNEDRAHAWDKAITLASPINLVAGSYFGLVTNSASDSAKSEYGVVESSLLQQVLNIGLLGTIFYYGLIISITKLVHRGNRITMCIWSALFQTLFYQSIEVIPFVFILMTLPVFDAGDQRRRR